MTHSIRFDEEDTQPVEHSISRFGLQPPADMDDDELAELRSELEAQGLVDESMQSTATEAVETLTVRELFETPVEFEGKEKSLSDILAAPIPLADGSTLPITELSWLVEADDWDVDSVRQVSLDEVLDTPIDDMEGLTLRELYDIPIRMDASGKRYFLGEEGDEPFIGVYEQWEATFEYNGGTYTLEDVAFALLSLDEDRSTTPLELFMHTPLGLAYTESGEGYRTLSPDELDEAYPLRLAELLEEHYGLRDPVALGMGEMAMAGPLTNLAVSMIPTIVVSANYIRNNWEDILKLIRTIGDFYAKRDKAIETTVAVECPDGSSVSIEYTGDAAEFQTILSELEVACN